MGIKTVLLFLPLLYGVGGFFNEDISLTVNDGSYIVWFL